MKRFNLFEVTGNDYQLPVPTPEDLRRFDNLIKCLICFAAGVVVCLIAFAFAIA